MKCPSGSLRLHYGLNNSSRPSRLIAGTCAYHSPQQSFSYLSQPTEVKTPPKHCLRSSDKNWRRRANYSGVSHSLVPCSPFPPNQRACLEDELDQAQSEKDVVRMLEIAAALKRAQPISPDRLRLMYGHLVSVLGHYALWTQLYATVNELFDSLPIEAIDDALWSSILDGFVRCGRSTDVILSLLLASRDDHNTLGRRTVSSLLRAAILESNLGQAIYLLQTSVKFNVVQSLDKILLVQLACLFLEHNQTLLATDLVHNFVLPITHTDHPHCMPPLIHFLRKSLDQSDPQSTLYCYSYLANHHPEQIQELIQQDSGFMVQLLNLASRYIKPELTLNILSQLIKTNKSPTTSPKKKNILQVQHLVPAIISLCRAGGHTEQVIKTLISLEQECVLLPQEIELIAFNLFLSHLGGLEQFRKLHTSNDSGQPTSSMSDRDVQESIKSLHDSEEICKKMVAEQREYLVKGKDPNHNHPGREQTNSRALTSLINSLIQANLEMHRVDKSIEMFIFYFQPLPLVPSPPPPPSLSSCNKPATGDNPFNPLTPDQFTLSLLKNAADRTSDPHLQSQISSLIAHHFPQSHSP